MIKQYVNLTYDAEKRHGRTVTYRVSATPSLGRRVKWILEADPSNTDLKYLSQKERARFQKDETVEDRQGYFRNTLFLPHVGGDKYKVKVHRAEDDPSTAVLVEEIETWRKIYITVHWIEQTGKQIYTNIKQRLNDGLAAGFVECEEVLVAKPAQTQLHRNLNDRSLRSKYKELYPLAHKPFHLRIVLVKEAYRDKEGMTTVLVNETTNDALAEVVKSGSNYKVKAKLDKELIEDDDWLVSAAGAERVGGGWGPAVDLGGSVEKEDSRTLVVDLGAHAGLNTALETGGRVGVTFRFKYKDKKNGSSQGNWNCVRTDRGGDRAAVERGILGTFVHENGHAFAQVVREEQLYDDKGEPRTGVDSTETNAMFYTDEFGGKGRHCHTNAKLQASSSTASGQIYKWDNTAGGDLCTMYHAGSAHRNDGVFCDSCLPRLKRANLSAQTMLAAGWDRY